jgi:enolase
MYKIENVNAREILDSRWNPTVEVELTLNNWIIWRAICPSWASTWKHEALEMRDWDKSRYLWKWVIEAVKNVNISIKKDIVWDEFKSYRQFDEYLIRLDWTKNKSKLWANAILPVSMAFVDACSKTEKKEIYEYLWNWEWNTLPFPMMNILNWGSHADNNVDIQEFMIVPIWATNIKEAIRMWAEVFHNLKKLLKERWLATSVWDEWWYAPNLWSNEEAIQIIIEAIQKAWYDTNQIKIALDVASSEFYENWKYNLSGEWKILDWKELVEYYKKLVEKYPIISIEDWLAEDDFESWKIQEKEIWNKIMTVWDDLFVTNLERLQIWIDEKLANSILIKLNQIWTVSETIDAIDLAKKHNMKSIISHRSWETEDTFIADLAVAKNTWFIKTWSLSRTDRIAKYNRLIRIEEKLNNESKYWK